MNLAVSSIAWHATEDAEALGILSGAGIGGVELVPRRFAGDPPLQPERLSQVKYHYRVAGVDPIACQALLFGYQGAMHLFRTNDERAALAKHLEFVCASASLVGAKTLVFGCPRNRYIDENIYPRLEAEKIAIDFFRQVADVAAKYGTNFCVEANPESYGCNFLVRTLEAANFVRLVDRPGCALILDMGTVLAQQENLYVLWPKIMDVVAHVHLSEPNLKPVGQNAESQKNFILLAQLLRDGGYDQGISIEMARCHDVSWRENLQRAVDWAQKHFI